MKSTTSGLSMVWRVDSKLLTEMKNSIDAYGFELEKVIELIILENTLNYRK